MTNVTSKELEDFNENVTGYGVIKLVSMCGLADQCWIHKQKVGGSSPVTVNMLCP